MHNTITSTDEQWLHRALALAQQGLYSTMPNPRVGCVIRRDNKTIGEGAHQRTGEAHAEIIAMQECGGDVRGAEVFLTLEPCSHVGHTDSCAKQLVAAGVVRVVCAMPDPNPQVAGRGLQILREAGIETAVASAESDLFQQALMLNIGFVSRMNRKRPWLRLKIAITADGKTALSSGLSRWISNEESRLDAHKLRARSCAVITGIGTALADNPKLTARNVNAPRQPLRVLIDRNLQASPTMDLFADGALVATAEDNAAAKKFATQFDELDGQVEVLSLPNEHGRVDLAAFLQELGTRNINEATVEAGRRLCGAFLSAGLVDEIVIYQAPLIFGGGMPMIEMPPPSSPQEAERFALRSCTTLGDDVKIVYDSPTARKMLSDATANTII